MSEVIHLPHWLVKHGYVRTNSEARVLIAIGKVVIDGHRYEDMDVHPGTPEYDRLTSLRGWKVWRKERATRHGHAKMKRLLLRRFLYGY